MQVLNFQGPVQGGGFISLGTVGYWDESVQAWTETRNDWIFAAEIFPHLGPQSFSMACGTRPACQHTIEVSVEMHGRTLIIRPTPEMLMEGLL